MSPWFRIPLGLFVAFLGYLILKKTTVVQTWFGRIPIAEQKLGPGGSRTAYKLIGVLVAFLGVAISTNLISNMLTELATFLTGG